MSVSTSFVYPSPQATPSQEQAQKDVYDTLKHDCEDQISGFKRGDDAFALFNSKLDKRFQQYQSSLVNPIPSQAGLVTELAGYKSEYETHVAVIAKIKSLENRLSLALNTVLNAPPYTEKQVQDFTVLKPDTGHSYKVANDVYQAYVTYIKDKISEVSPIRMSMEKLDRTGVLVNMGRIKLIVDGKGSPISMADKFWNRWVSYAFDPTQKIEAPAESASSSASSAAPSASGVKKPPQTYAAAAASSSIPPTAKYEDEHTSASELGSMDSTEVSSKSHKEEHKKPRKKSNHTETPSISITDT